MKAIHKFPLPVETECFVPMPRRAEVLCVQVQNGTPFVWALVDTKEKVTAKHWFFVYGTGHETFEQGKYLGTFQLEGGALVFHVFDNGDGGYLAAPAPGPAGDTK